MSELKSDAGALTSCFLCLEEHLKLALTINVKKRAYPTIQVANQKTNLEDNINAALNCKILICILSLSLNLQFPYK